MGKRGIDYSDLLDARTARREGRNVTELLRRKKGLALNTPEIIETAYDLHAGTTTRIVEANVDAYARFAAEAAGILGRHLNDGDTLLDAGAGELTTTGLLAPRLFPMPERILALDISWSRLFTGRDFARKEMGAEIGRLEPFVADMGEIPLRDKSVDVTMTSHSLEPNGGRLGELLAELFRVTARKLVLFEPCYEINSDAGKRRMDELGYIKDVAGEVERLGGRLDERIAIAHGDNPLNPTACFVITPPAAPVPRRDERPGDIFSVPGTDHPLAKIDGFYFSDETGLCFPVLEGIPLLKSDLAILASALADRREAVAEIR